MTKQQWIWFIALVGVALLAVTFIYANWLQRVPFVFK
jgi:type VI protein secretion system component VasF